MEILVIAYEFPPVCSAQSLRWHYLSAELARMGHRVKVITTDFRIDRHLAPRPDTRVDVLRCFPGLFVGGANRLEARLSRGRRSGSAAMDPANQPSGTLNRIYRSTRNVLDQVVFPDVRTEWYVFAARTIRRLDRSGYRPDLVIGSHEPAVDLQLGIAAKRRFNAPFLADLGDPIETIYSPRWRRRLDRLYERYVLGRADGAIVTLESVKHQLEERHAKPPGRIEVIPQGFDHRRSAGSNSTVPFRPDRLNILFTGTLYESFRNPAAFLAAVARRSDVQLWIAGNLVGAFPATSHSENIRTLGPLEHLKALDAQASADVLLSIGNRQAEQIPGKIYEYFGSKRPILHVYFNQLDPTCKLISELQRGWTVRSDAESSAAILDKLVESWRHGLLEQGLDLTSSHAKKFSWRARAERMVRFGDRLRN